VIEARAPAKINLALVVGPRRPDGKHELVTLYERLDLADTLRLEGAAGLEVVGFEADSLVTGALRVLAAHGGVDPCWRVTIEKRIPVASGLGGGSSDAAAALRLANSTLADPLDDGGLHLLASRLGADVPFFLTTGPQLGQGDGTTLSPVSLPRDYHVVLLLPRGVAKHSTKSVYDAFDDRDGAKGFAGRRALVLSLLDEIGQSRDLAGLPLNDLSVSPFRVELERLGAIRADVSGAGPCLYGLFEDAQTARGAAARLAALGHVWVTTPAWYG
jgi:4-diphosphocytidyl-2-C-methyl-D-erythritol kinase